MTLLLGLIFSFHIQYRQPPSFYLKSPTLLYVFVFIALRALNFDARNVVTAGLVAVARLARCWSLYVITIDPRDSMITRDYVNYMTSNSVLIGAEVDKIISILVVTGDARARDHAQPRACSTFAVTESASNQELARFVPNEVATPDQDRPTTASSVGSGEPAWRPCCSSTSRASRRSRSSWRPRRWCAR